MPAVFGLPVLSNVFLSRSREEFSEDGGSQFVSDKVSLTFEQRFRPADDLLVTYGYAFERNYAFDLNARPGDPFVRPHGRHRQAQRHNHAGHSRRFSRHHDGLVPLIKCRVLTRPLGI